MATHHHDKIRPVPAMAATGTPLAPWTYRDPELSELELEALFHSRWQFVGHTSELPAPGHYLTQTIGGSGVFQETWPKKERSELPQRTKISLHIFPY